VQDRPAHSRAEPLRPSVLRWLQGTAGNGAVAGALAAQPLQRRRDQAGWTGADTRGEGWNAGDKLKWGIHRVPLESLTLGNQEAFSGDHVGKDGKVEHGGANERAKTTESAAGRAIVLVPEALDHDKPVAVLLHLHGYTSREWDPYAGWRQRSGDHTVRDVALDRIEEQMHAVGDPQTVGVLPQGVGQQEFVVPGLVAAEQQAGAVVALEEDAGAADRPGEPRRLLQRGRQVGQADARQALHGLADFGGGQHGGRHGQVPGWG
jgi:hypothetical protein